MTDPIEHLLEEHRVLMAALAPLRAALDRLGKEGDRALPEARLALAAAGDLMAGPLLRHARKEDDVLFPAIEAALGGGGPTVVMREEHREIHERAARFREALREAHEVEHPALLQGGAAIRELTRRGGGASEVRTLGLEVLRLLDLHFAKEEQVLFPMAQELLPAPDRAEIGRRIEAIDAEKVG